MRQPGPSVDVVICAHDARRRATLDRLLGAVAAELKAGDHVVVVVDRAPDLASDLRNDHPGIDVLVNTGAAGLSSARNSGIRATSGEVVIFFDDDAVPRTGWRRTIVQRFTDENLFVLGGAVDAEWIGRDGRPTWFPAEFDWVVGCDYAGMSAGGRIRGPIGACMAVRRSAFDSCGLFLEGIGRIGSLPVGGEETELSLRIARTRPSALIERDTSWGVDHQVPRNRQRFQYFLRRCYWEGHSKALWAAHHRHVGALSPERAHVAQILRSAVASFSPRRRTPGGSTPSASALALVGLGITAIGFLRGRLSRPHARLRPALLTPPAASVILCTIGRSAHLRDAVSALLGQTVDHIELIVVDNAAEVGAVAAALDGIDDPRLRIVREAKPGLSAARNRGIIAARADIVAFTDDDAIADAEWLAHVLRAFADDPDASCVTGRVLPVSTVRDAEAWFEMGISFDKGAAPLRWNGRQRPAHARGVRRALYPYTAGEFGSGNNMAFRREIFRRVGGFARSLGAGTPSGGGEDLDMFRRIALADTVIRYEPKAVVRHHHRPDLDALQAQMFAYGSGMAASITRFCVTTPWGLAHIVPRLPAAARLLWDPASSKNHRKSADYPRALDRAERRGYANGVFLYLRGAVRVARRRRPRV